MEGKEFQVGDLVRLSEIGRKNSKRPGRRGQIVGRTKTRTQWQVLWSGLKMPQLVHWNRLSGSQIDAAYAKALSSGRRTGSGGLSPRTVHHMHCVLKRALGQAVRWQLLLRNPADAATPPKVEKQEMQTYDLQETAALIDAMRPTPMHVPTLLAALCGLRRGEIAALRWRNIDFEAGSLSVAASVEQTNNGTRIKPPKSGKARTVALSGTMLDELRHHRLEQAQSLLKLGVRLSDDHFVCAHADGSMMQPTYLTHAWVRLVRASGLPVRRLHDLRHAHATHLLAAGIHPKVASERLGHSKIGITLDLYSHVMHAARCSRHR